MDDPFKQQLRLKKPCANCPFRKQGAIDLRPGRLEGIIQGLLANDKEAFNCHKTLSARDVDFGVEGGVDIAPSNHIEAMCAGAAAYLMKKGRPTVSMRFAFHFGSAKPSDWDEAQKLIID